MSKFDVLRPSTPPEQESPYRWATVTQASPLRIKIDGEAAELPITPVTLKSGLAVNDYVLVLLLTNTDPTFHGHHVVIVGRSGG